ncbi:MAG TPA: group II truncated hemoglobin [Paracoccaceae bacterium]|nr:group II truncated hemoglobin [Paracoccaceae bacterium]
MESPAPESSAAESAQSPFDRLGGQAAIAQVVERFYDLMDADPQFAELRVMHGADLAPMRQSLTGFLTGWAGGPRTWFDENPGKCMMSMHGGLPITRTTAAQWVDAMGRAFADCGLADHPVAQLMQDRFAMMSRAMAGAETAGSTAA